LVYTRVRPPFVGEGIGFGADVLAFFAGALRGLAMLYGDKGQATETGQGKGVRKLGLKIVVVVASG